MKDLTQALSEIAGICESLSARYAVMGGIAVRIHGIPRPTHDVDFTVALDRERLSDFFQRAVDAGYTVASRICAVGWIRSRACRWWNYGCTCKTTAST